MAYVLKQRPDWRRKQVPACPVCSKPPGPAYHRGCKDRRAVAQGKNQIFIDMNTGYNYCAADCRDPWPMEDTTHYCSGCGAKHKGGEIWEDMRFEVGSFGGYSWLTEIGYQYGDWQSYFLGWYRCLACKVEEEKRMIHNLRSGGICQTCLNQADRRDRSWFYRRRKGQCSYCGVGHRARNKIVEIRDHMICNECIDYCLGG